MKADAMGVAVGHRDETIGQRRSWISRARPMKKRGLRFQSKLMLTFATTIALVTFALLFATEAKIKQTYLAQLTREFGLLIERLEESRESQTSEFRQLSEELATRPFVIQSLKGGAEKDAAEEFWKYYLQSIRTHPSGKPLEGTDRPGQRPSLSRSVVGQIGIVAIMTPEGEVRALPFPGSQNNGKPRQRRMLFSEKRAKADLKRVIDKDSQQTFYIPIESLDGREVVHKMVGTPVNDPDTGERLGLFLRSTLAETEAERSLERYQREFGNGDEVHTGTYVGGSIYSRGMDPELAERFDQVIDDHIVGESYPAEIRKEIPVGDEEYYLYLERLTEEGSLRPAYQVAAIPLTALRNDLEELRLRGSGIGLGVLLLGLLASWFLSRNLAVPVRELTSGTRAIQEGDLDHRVGVRSRDEIGELAESFNEMAEELKQKALYRELLGKVSDETVAHALVSGTLDLELGGEVKDVSVLFCDIRGFTGLTEHMHPGEVIEMLNEHMTAMTAIVRKHFGVVDKFVGDEIMALFGALKSYDNDALHAAECALEMIEERKRLNATNSPSIDIGIGVATGEVVAGCMGSTDRLNYTVLGARVNLAARLCSAAGKMEAVVDDATVSSIFPTPDTEILADLELKGFSASVHAHRLLSLKEPASLYSH